MKPLVGRHDRDVGIERSEERAQLLVARHVGLSPELRWKNVRPPVQQYLEPRPQPPGEVTAPVVLVDQPAGARRDVLLDQGNMSAPTVLFVLERLLARGLPERTLMTAFGPGFTCAGLLLERP